MKPPRPAPAGPPPNALGQPRFDAPLSSAWSALFIRWKITFSTYSKMTRLAASVATTAGTGSTYAQSWAVGLDMAKTLTVVALLCCRHLSAFPTAGTNLGGRVLSVVRGSGQPFDSCPEASVRCLSNGWVFYPPGCLPGCTVSNLVQDQI